ncbi:type IV inositol polyphosphate 5-phosphatase 3 isoform X2 [Punica granatum]|uniref:Type IV inositol polyphosphate 5-phosphatase 3 isoform X2 n=1 Tax=Punica granatum TaxID=22663 RepID=A0A218XJQ3_PUNGR|nr:type IV inositol polyphosphate 5-phosphatase 3 isoform X2 [Punica granatum]XP_031392160.1 type IV inositol polyphosphate 5-phosphatase 3 isoform X2 [Punica granatum]XP_031392161.1 type IV inositol polyphosphate 5-phosphatase 3 isoform X2 [Punica granatum]OWM85028.1 hypothetical protein CDL15_Pgr027815 [Punica granatum]
MRQRSRRQSELFWARVVMRKWLNISAKDSDYSADTDEDDVTDSESESDTEECEQNGRESRFKNDPNATIPMLRRRKSETFRAQYINTKELKICVGTWNVGGKLPPDDLVIDDWLGIAEPADIYVLGFQEIVPLNAGNIFGAEDNRPVPKWENIIRETLNRVQPPKAKVKSYSDPPSPSRFQPSEDIPNIVEETLLEADSDCDEEIHPADEEPDSLDEDQTVIIESDNGSLHSSENKFGEPDLQRQFLSPKKLDRLNCLRTEDNAENIAVPVGPCNGKLTRLLSVSERVGLSWPEPPLNLISQCPLDRTSSFKSVKSVKASRSFRTFNSFKSSANEVPPDLSLLAEIDLGSLLRRRRRPHYVRIISKQMVGIFLTIWVRSSLRRRIQNVRVSTVGVGVMGYIGNKGSISVSMSIDQTPFCFICTHLTSGEKDGDELKRNADVHEIHRRTLFRSISGVKLPITILGHDKIIWLGDLNYRINLSYEKARELISKKEWSKLTEREQLSRELRKGRTFDGWSEGLLNFPPTYKYEFNSEKYYGEDPKIGRRTPAWCDRILSRGKGMRQLSYRRAELKLSDHRPVSATYMAEVEVFNPKKLQRALTFTNAEIENEDIMTAIGINSGICGFGVDGEGISDSVVRS